MTKLLEDAIKKVRELSATEQDDLAAMLLSVASKADLVEIDDETRTAIRTGREQSRRGEFIHPRDMAAFFKKHGVSHYGA